MIQITVDFEEPAEHRGGGGPHARDLAVLEVSPRLDPSANLAPATGPPLLRTSCDGDTSCWEGLGLGKKEIDWDGPFSADDWDGPHSKHTALRNEFGLWAKKEAWKGIRKGWTPRPGRAVCASAV